MTIVDVAVQTGSPSTVASSLRVVTMAWPPASRTVSTVQHADDLVTGGDRTVVDEPLLAVDDPAEVDAGLGVGDRAACRTAGR